MNQTYDKTYSLNRTYVQNQRINTNKTYNRSSSPRTNPKKQTYNTSVNTNLTYNKDANNLNSSANRTYNRSSRKTSGNRTYDVDEHSDDSSSICFVQEEDYSSESSEPVFESSESDVGSFSQFARLQSTPNSKYYKNLDLSQEVDGIKRLEDTIRKRYNASLGRTFTASPSKNYSTPADKTFDVDGKNTSRRSTPTRQYYVNTPTKASSPANLARENKKVARILNFSNHVDNLLNFSNHVSVTKTDPNGYSVTYTREKSGPDVSVLDA